LDVLLKQVSLLPVLGTAATAQAGIVFTDSVQDMLSSLDLEPLASDFDRVVVISWQYPPRIDSAITETVTELARVAASIWPDWPVTQGESDSGRSRTSTRWRARAEALCRAGKLLLPADASHAVNVRELCYLFGPADLHLVFAVFDADSTDPGLDALCRVLHWLTAHSQVSAHLLLDQSLHDSPELASLDFTTIKLCTQSTGPSKNPLIESKTRFWPLQGKPHPLSPGEIRLSEALQHDRVLQDVFEFNTLVRTAHGSNYYVDLLAAHEQAIVEIDGYRHHSSPRAFALDRQRDFELQTSGYLVLRLPHSEVLDDLPNCLSKIKHFIQYRRKTRGDDET
jgi:very-short-patch-repair endonuclease